VIIFLSNHKEKSYSKNKDSQSEVNGPINENDYIWGRQEFNDELTKIGVEVLTQRNKSERWNVWVATWSLEGLAI
jgi:hypothetical protein